MPLVPGPQGGHHVSIRVRAKGVQPEGAEVDYGVLDAESGEEVTIPDLRLRVDLRRDGEWWASEALRAFLAGPADEVEEREVTLWADLTDADGVSLRAEASARAWRQR